MTPEQLLAVANDLVRQRRARPWLHVAPDGQPHFYLRTAPYGPEDVDIVAELLALGSTVETLTIALHDGGLTAEEFRQRYMDNEEADRG